MSDAAVKGVDDDETNTDDKLNAIIAQALDGGEAAEAPELETSADRDERGRFRSKQAAEGGTDAPAAEAPVAETASPENAQPVEPAVAPPAWTDGHFAGWKPEQRERFNSLPPDVQKLVMERQAESQAFYDRKLTEEREFRRSVTPVYEAVKKIEPFARQIGATPDQLLVNYANIEHTLQYGTYADKVDLLAKIAKAYNVPFAQPEPDPYADPLQQNGQAYPVFHDMQSELARLRAELNAERAQREQALESQLASQVQAFATATNADGSPKYPFFETVRASMGPLLANGQARTMEEAYQLAVKPIQERLDREIAARAKQQTEAQAQVVARAKKAAPIRTSGDIPNGKTKAMSLDALLEQTLSQAGMN